MNRIAGLRDSIQDGQVILFVGAGVSATLGMPSWSQLIDFLAEDLKMDSSVFKLHGDNLMLAEYYHYEKGNFSALVDWLLSKEHEAKAQLEQSEIHQLITELNFPIIYTTNYDGLLEEAFKLYNKPFQKIVSVKDIPSASPGATQILKYHGDLSSSEESLVLTESSYFSRMDFESPLDIKLRADFLGKSVLYIGYGLKDINLMYLLYKLDQLWRDFQVPDAKPESFIFMGIPNWIQAYALMKRGILPITGVESADPAQNLLAFLRQLRPLQRGEEE